MEDGLSRQALAAARALAQAGWTVGVGEQIPHGIASSSRAATHRHRAPAPNEDPDGFVIAVNAAIEQVGYEVVFGARDVEVLLLSRRREEIGAEIPYPPHEHVTGAMDKERLYEAALSVGIPTPRTEPATAEAMERCPLPSIVKARLHVSGEGAESTLPRLETCRGNTRDELRQLVSEMSAAGGQPLLQEVVPGHLLELAILCERDGRLVAHVQQKAEGVWPPGAGVSARARTVPTDEGLLDRAGALAGVLGWWGLAELQFLVPPEGEPHLIDFNGRFYGSLALAVAAGVNAPAMWAAMATGRPVPAAQSATVGRRYQWLVGDLLRALDGGRRGAVRRTLGTLAYGRGATQSVFVPRDPLPAARYMTILAANRLR